MRELLARPSAPLRGLADRARLASALLRGGAAPPAAHAHADLLARCAGALLAESAEGDRSACAFVVPGRIEVLGKHTDYAGGRSLLAAVDRGLCFVAAPRPDGEVRVRDLMDPRPLRLPVADAPPGSGWRLYPPAVVRRLDRAFPERGGGADIAFVGDLPQAAGLSSSSALVTGVLLALAAARGLVEDGRFRERVEDPEALADLAGAIESGAPFRDLVGDEGVGTRGGSEDHTALLCARAGHVVQYAFGPVRRERVVPVREGWTFLVACSGVTAEKTGPAREAYNSAASAARALLDLWREEGGGDAPHLAAALSADPGAAARLRTRPAARPFLPRLEQFLTESEELVPAAAAALDAGDLARLGRIAERSMTLAEEGLANQVPETLHLVRGARAAGAVAASAFGAGFGGSVWALVEVGRAAEVLAAWKADYLATFPERRAASAFFATAPGPPAMRVS